MGEVAKDRDGDGVTMISRRHSSTPAAGSYEQMTEDSSAGDAAATTSLRATERLVIRPESGRARRISLRRGGRILSRTHTHSDEKEDEGVGT
jgi:hypothetical protein